MELQKKTLNSRSKQGYLSRLSSVIETISGLRGVYPEGINTEYVFSAACRFSRYLGKGKIALGMDTRASSYLLSKAASAGVMYGGCKVAWLGIVTTPELFHFVRNKKIEGGIMVTASHNPQEWNGLKLIKEGRGLFQDELQDALSTKCDARLIGSEAQESSESYYEDILRMLGKELYGIRIGLDLGGGSACLHVPSIYRRAGAQVYAVNASPGIFTRIIDPTQDSLEQLAKIMKLSGCSVGFAFDCDGDRLQVVDRQYGKLPPDYTLYLAIKNARDVDKVVLSVDTSDIVFEEAKRKGMQVFFSPVGEANVLKEMLKNGCALGGEGSSAGVIDSRYSYCRDGLLASTYVVKEIARRGELNIEEFRGHVVIRRKFEVDSRSSELAMKRLEKEFPDASKLDGIKVRFDEGWCLVRKSKTEEAIRISVEATTKEKAEKMIEIMSSKILSFMKGG